MTRRLSALGLRDEFDFDCVEIWVFNGTKLLAVECLYGDPKGADAADTRRDSSPSPTALHALRSDGPLFWNGLYAPTSLLARETNRMMKEAGGVRDYLIVPIRLASQICIVWEVSRVRSSDLDTDSLERLCGKLFLISCELQADSILNVPEAELQKGITAREIEILNWFKRGKTYSEIAAILGISSKTVDYHFGKLMRKLNVNDKLSAILKAARLGLIDID